MDAYPRQRALILLVDDDARTGRLLVRMMREDGFDVELATDGASAIARLTREPIPDALVTDFRLPHADGLAVAQFARSRRPEVPILVITGYPEIVAGRAGRLHPLPVVHTKPVDYASLCDGLRRALAQA